MIRSLLFLPGNNPNMIMNGDILGSDAIIFDLEDAVAPDEKDAARILVRNAMRDLDFRRVQVVIRINSLDDNEFWKRDLEAVVPFKPDFIMPPKISDLDELQQIEEYVGELEARQGFAAYSISLIPLIETAAGVENAYDLARCEDRVKALFLGAEDLTADLRCARTGEGKEIFYARTRLVMAARAAGVAVYDTPFTDVNDDQGLIEDARLAKSLGFSGKAAISPRHVRGINEVFSPTPAEVAYAREVLAVIAEAKAQGKGAISLKGKMIDAPIVLRAKQVLEAAGALQGGSVQ